MNEKFKYFEQLALLDYGGMIFIFIQKGINGHVYRALHLPSFRMSIL